MEGIKHFEVMEMIEVFQDNDDDYFGWINANSNGFVVNTRRCCHNGYMVLHRASCLYISAYKGEAKPGGFTERNYIKICSNIIDDLENWVRKKGGKTFSKKCGRCNPS